MFRCQEVAWTILGWSMIFLYTLLTYFEVRPIFRTIPLIALFFIAIALAVLVAHAAKATKTLLIFSIWVILSLIGITLKTLDIITDWQLNMIVSVFTILAAMIWCIAGHVKHVTESGFYWYVWSILSILTILAAFNNDSQAAIIIYISNTAILALIHIFYIRHVFAVQTYGHRRCRHVFRTAAVFCIFGSLLTGSIFYKVDTIDEIEWQIWVIVTEAVLFIVLVTDGILGFTQSRINAYDLAPNVEDEPV